MESMYGMRGEWVENYMNEDMELGMLVDIIQKYCIILVWLVKYNYALYKDVLVIDRLYI